MLIKDPSGEAVWNETEAIEPGEKFNRTYGSLDPFEDYTAVIVPVVDGKDQSPVEENFTTGNRRRYFVLPPTTPANAGLFCFSSGQGVDVCRGDRRGRGFLGRGSSCKRRFDRWRLVQTDPSERLERRTTRGLCCWLCRLGLFLVLYRLFCDFRKVPPKMEPTKHRSKDWNHSPVTRSKPIRSWMAIKLGLPKK